MCCRLVMPKACSAYHTRSSSAEMLWEDRWTPGISYSKTVGPWKNSQTKGTPWACPCPLLNIVNLIPKYVFHTLSICCTRGHSKPTVLLIFVEKQPLNWKILQPGFDSDSCFCANFGKNKWNRSYQNNVVYTGEQNVVFLFLIDWLIDWFLISWLITFKE